MFGLTVEEFKRLQIVVRTQPRALSEMRSWQTMMVRAYLQSENGKDRTFPPREEETLDLIRRHAVSIAESFGSHAEAMKTLEASLKDGISILKYRDFILMTSKAHKIDPSQNVVFLKLNAYMLQTLIGVMKIRTLDELDEILKNEGFRNKSLEAQAKKVLAKARISQPAFDFSESAA